MIDLKLDFCFKYIFTNQCDSDSTYLLNLLVEQTTHFPLKRYIITNPEILKLDANDKTIRYDILIQDQQGNQIDIEMQRSHFSKTQAKRFGFYGATLIYQSLNVGEHYANLKHNVQIILIDDIHEEHHSLIEAFEARTPLGQREIKTDHDEDILLIRYYIYLPYIDVIAKEKGVGQLSDFEMMIYILQNGINEKVKKYKERKIVQMMERRMLKLQMDNESLKRAMEREVALACDKEEKKEYERRGIKIGEDRGERKALKDCVAFKYPKNDLNWIDDCNEIQCQMIKELLFQDLSYEQFYESIQKYIA